MPKEKKQGRTEKIPEKKKKALADLVDNINKNSTVMIVSIENISTLQFLQIKRAIKDLAVVKVLKKNVIIRALENLKDNKKGIESLEQWLNGSFAILISNKDPFELASILSQNKFPAKAKAGQTSPKDIIVEAGPTDLPAGPMISELSKVKIKSAIENGKITIKEPQTLVKEGEQISMDAASILTKLEIIPFSIGLMPLVAYDSEKCKIYEKIKVDRDEMIQEIKIASAKALALALNIGYPAKDTISLLLAKAGQESNIILNLIKS